MLNGNITRQTTPVTGLAAVACFVSPLNRAVVFMHIPVQIPLPEKQFLGLFRQIRAFLFQSGMMLLCDYPQAIFPQMSITAMLAYSVRNRSLCSVGVRFSGSIGETDVCFIDDKRIEGQIRPVMTGTL